MDSLEAAQPTVKAPSEDASILRIKGGCSLDYLGQAQLEVLTTQPEPRGDGEGEKVLVQQEMNSRSHTAVQDSSR
jgi:hypothetical protein